MTRAISQKKKKGPNCILRPMLHSSKLIWRSAVRHSVFL